VLCGTGTAGVYQAGVLRALTEAGVKIDLIAAHGVGVFNALCGAIDGGSKLWDPAGPWLSPRPHGSYRWRPALRAAGWGLVAAALFIVSPLLVILLAVAVYALSVLAGLINLPDLSARLASWFREAIAGLFDPPIVPTVMPRAVVLAGLVVLGVLVASAVRAWRHDRSRKRWRGAFWWHLLGTPLDPDELESVLVDTIWTLVRGASTAPRPGMAEVGRRTVDVLTDNFGQPGFREVLIAVHDLDGRRDLVGAVVAPDLRAGLAVRREAGGPREAEYIDFTGPDRDLLANLVVGAVRLPVASPPELVTFPAESYWRGESHRVCDRPELAVRLVEEIAAAGVEQVVLVAAVPPPAVPHGMRSKPGDFRGRIGETLRSLETAAFEDAAGAAASRFSGVFVIRPDHNPIGPFDFSGAYDEASDRRRAIADLLEQGYKDTYRQFIEPIVASGERVDAY
jgi:hypothetical protein